MQQTQPKIIFTDLDGTLLNPEQLVSHRDVESLQALKAQKVVCVIATGRSLFSLAKVINDDFPIDYIIFSSGAGIIDWNRKTIIFAESLRCHEVESAVDAFLANNIDFMIHHPIPDNHKFDYHHNGNHNPDFIRRCNLYKNFASPLDLSTKKLGKASQLIGIIPHQPKMYEAIKKQLSALKVIRATSPLDGRSIWIEIFPSHISKAHGANWLCQRLGFDRAETIGIGNDYNDLDLLGWTHHSFVVANSPKELKAKYPLTLDNQKSGFSQVASQFFSV